MPLISATVVKEETSSRLGIAFERENEHTAMKIKLIREDSLFASSQLVPGLVVVSAAGQDMEGMSPKDAADALRNAPGGEEISLVCKGAIATVKKDKPKRFKKPPKLGISFKSTTAEPGKVFISNIKEDSKFTGTDLAVGQQVLAINGEPCPLKVADAVEMLKAPEEITIVALDPEDEKVIPKPKTEEPPEQPEMVEEKKEEFQEAPAAADGSEGGAAEEEEQQQKVEEDLTPEANKPLLDTVFGACIC
mmetsp:Transcript_7817/g.14492  ORF Transcript_7817/g.14492 Transcript_7817/m.14492 type:complete len:249 (-) Transcript_7817:1206-1952(-)|eukprot:CAMPEP_0178750620 /NCGR_PEP_ID=MMETSP0744-20121128/10096_1 /TAXON_ID=913974 /ORGANISM="Nitzschia punctata, Strain CCMP561" /LENGTH=248 /DNA_ID=CAMNT_0020404223 /DNA_START=139 /DNA_END=885 /DNA_ORIENTATION=+